LLEFDLPYSGWEASVSYVLAPESRGNDPALLLFEGRIDEEGLIEIRDRWKGPAPRSFEPERLRICLVAPGDRTA
jgi:hypothetical protein